MTDYAKLSRNQLVEKCTMLSESIRRLVMETQVRTVEIEQLRHRISLIEGFRIHMDQPYAQ